MLRSALLCLAWLLISSSALAQSAAPSPAPAPAPAAQPVLQSPKSAPAPQTAPPSPAQPQAPRATAPDPAATSPSAAAPDAARKVRLRVTVDVIDPSRDVRDIISELRTHRREGPAPAASAPGKGQALRERAPGAARELREVRSERRELRRERRDARIERLEERQRDKAPQGGRSLRAAERKPNR